MPYLHFLLLDHSFDVDFDVLDEAKVERVPRQVNEESYTAWASLCIALYSLINFLSYFYDGAAQVLIILGNDGFLDFLGTRIDSVFRVLLVSLYSGL